MNASFRYDFTATKKLQLFSNEPFGQFGHFRHMDFFKQNTTTEVRHR